MRAVKQEKNGRNKRHRRDKDGIRQQIGTYGYYCSGETPRQFCIARQCEDGSLEFMIEASHFGSKEKWSKTEGRIYPHCCASFSDPNAFIININKKTSPIGVADKRSFYSTGSVRRLTLKD